MSDLRKGINPERIKGKLVFEVIAPDGVDITGAQVALDSADSDGGPKTVDVVNTSVGSVSFTAADIPKIFIGEQYKVQAFLNVGDKNYVELYDTVVVQEEDVIGEKECIFKIYLKKEGDEGYEDILKELLDNGPFSATAIGTPLTADTPSRKAGTTRGRTVAPKNVSSTVAQLEPLLQSRCEDNQKSIKEPLAEVSKSANDAAQPFIVDRSLKGVELTKAYTNMLSAIKRGYNNKQASKLKKTMYATLLQRVTNAYLDRLVEHAPEGLKGEDIDALQGSIELLKEMKQLSRLVRSWKVEDLQKVHDAPALGQIMAILT